MNDNKKTNEKDAGKKPVEENLKNSNSTDWHDLDIQNAATHYATSKPPGRKYPVNMATDMLAMFVDEEAAAPPPAEGTEQPASKKQKTASTKK